MNSSRNFVLPLVGLLALLIYILACTSFSPDDKKILFPTFDSSGALAMAIYDRDTRRTEQLYVPLNLDMGTNDVEQTILRGSWLPDGKHILVAAASDESSEQMELIVIPADGRRGIRSYRLFGVDDPGLSFLTPLCVSGNRFFFKPGSGRLARLDLQTGESKTANVTGVDDDFHLYPAPDGRGVFYLSEEDNQLAFGRVDSNQLTLTQLALITNNVAEGGFFAYDASGTRLAFLDKAENGDSRCVLMEKGTVRFTRKIDSGDRERVFANAILSPRADKVWAAFTREAPGTNRIACGLIEIPLTRAPIREKVLIPDTSAAGDGYEYYWQVGVSHDGRTAALSSTYLACSDQPFKPEDCALFIVDLGGRDWKVTKVPIALPAERSNPLPSK
jgi:hypothetical protein